MVVSLYPALPGRCWPAGLAPVRKLVRRLALASGKDRARVPGPGEEAEEGRRQVELTDVRGAGQAGWTLAFEATGPASLRSSRRGR